MSDFEDAEPVSPYAGARRLVQELLEGYPLYQSITLELMVDGPVPAADLVPAAIQQICSGSCKGKVTDWKRISHEALPSRRSPTPTVFGYGSGVLLHYRCAICLTRSSFFWVGRENPSTASAEAHADPNVWVDGVKIRKIGQWPGPIYAIPKELEENLTSEGIALYRKGLTCIAQGLGVGAFAYFRRTLDSASEALLEVVEEAATGDEDPKALEAVEGAKKLGNPDSRLKLLAAHVPPSLKAGGVNPLKVLADQVGRGQSSRDEELCLDAATQLQFAFEFVFRNVRARAEETRRLKARVQKAPRRS